MVEPGTVSQFVLRCFLHVCDVIRQFTLLACRGTSHDVGVSLGGLTGFPGHTHTSFGSVGGRCNSFSSVPAYRFYDIRNLLLNSG